MQSVWNNLGWKGQSTTFAIQTFAACGLAVCGKQNPRSSQGSQPLVHTPCLSSGDSLVRCGRERTVHVQLAPTPGAGDRGVTSRECVWPLATEWHPQLSPWKEMGTSVLEPQGMGFCLEKRTLSSSWECGLDHAFPSAYGMLSREPGEARPGLLTSRMSADEGVELGCSMCGSCSMATQYSLATSSLLIHVAGSTEFAFQLPS